MIRVANVLTDGRFAGPQNRVLQVAAGLEQHRIQTTVILPRCDSEVFYAKLQDAGVRSIRLRLHRLTVQKTHLLGWIVFFIPEVISLIRTFKRENFDIVHCNGTWQIKPVLAGWLARKRVVLHLNDTNTTLVARILFAVLKPLCSAFILAAEKCRVIYPLEGVDGVKVTVLPAPVDTALYDPAHAESDEAIANAPGVKILTVCSINSNKGLEYFIEAAGLLLAEGLDVSFHVVGNILDSQKGYMDHLYDQVARLPADRLTFHGPSSQIPEMLQATDVYVCSSVCEASPMAVWEAMAMAKAIVSTDVGDVARHLKDTRSGFIVPIRDARTLADKIALLVKSAELREDCGARARETAVALLDVSVCVERHRRFYEELANNGDLSDPEPAKAARRAA